MCLSAYRFFSVLPVPSFRFSSLRFFFLHPSSHLTSLPLFQYPRRLPPRLPHFRRHVAHTSLSIADQITLRRNQPIYSRRSTAIAFRLNRTHGQSPQPQPQQQPQQPCLEYHTTATRLSASADKQLLQIGTTKWQQCTIPMWSELLHIRSCRQ